MKKIILFFTLFYCNFLVAQMHETSFNQLAEVNEQWNNQIAVDQALYTKHAKSYSEQQLIQYHLQQVEILLRHKDLSKVSLAQQQERLKNLDVLHSYMEQGVFPINDKFEKRTPFFIDKNDTYCAVGYLMKMSGEDEMAKEIHATQNNSYLLQIQHPKLKEWIKKSGLSNDELALIQPSYGIDKPAFLLEMHYNNIGNDVNEYIEFMQASGNENGGYSYNHVTKILFYNESNILYKTLLVTQMESVVLPTILYGPVGFSYFYTPHFYHYTFGGAESFSDAGRIEFIGADNFGSNTNILCNEINYNSSAIDTKDYWSDGSGNHFVSKFYSVSENETTSIGTSLTFEGNYSPTLAPPAYTTYNLNSWNAYLLPSTPGALNILSVLPVSISSFNYTSKNNVVLLNWETLNEINVSHFKIERSEDGITFKTIGKVISLGNSSTKMQYNFVDENPLYINYYRLKQEETNGRASYSKILFVKTSLQNPIIIFENPVKNNLALKLNTDQLNNGSLTIFDFLGRKILSQKAVSGPQNINVSMMNSGNYIVQLSMKDGTIYNTIFIKAN